MDDGVALGGYNPISAWSAWYCWRFISYYALAARERTALAFCRLWVWINPAPPAARRRRQVGLFREMTRLVSDGRGITTSWGDRAVGIARSRTDWYFLPLNPTASILVSPATANGVISLVLRRSFPIPFLNSQNLSHNFPEHPVKGHRVLSTSVAMLHFSRSRRRSRSNSLHFSRTCSEVSRSASQAGRCSPCCSSLAAKSPCPVRNCVTW